MRLHSGRSIDQATDGFNSRTLGRVRLSSSHSMTTGVLFQFTHPWEGCDLGAPTYLPIHPCFNSRTLGRVRRSAITHYLQCPHVSIPAPWEGCDVCALEKLSTAFWFQFTHPGKGATASTLAEIGVLPSFQFTHPGKGATKHILIGEVRG